MKIKHFGFVICILSALFFVSCSKDFDSNADYKDATFVYAVLNSADDTHYVKIYKGFLTSGDAEVAAQVYDSLYYGDELSVTMEEYVNGRLATSWPLDTVAEIPMDAGDFASPKQKVYAFSRTLNPDAEYKVVIVNNESGRTVTATTNIVGEFMISSPSSRLLNVANSTPNPFKVLPAANAVSYEIFQNFYYIERNKTTHEEVVKCIRRRINNSAISGPTTKYTPSQLYTAIAANVHPDPSVDRYISVDSCVKFEVWAVNAPIANYVQSTQSTGSVVMDRLLYTNIEAEDGLARGIFGSRACASSWHGFSTTAQDELVRGSITGKLGFHYAYEYLDLDD